MTIEEKLNELIVDAVFVVHGHDDPAKQTVARFLERIGLEPVILHEQPNSGLTVPEKLEAFSTVGFAVILLTPDDVGGLVTEPDKLKPRARQNVILELGYFLGKLPVEEFALFIKTLKFLPIIKECFLSSMTLQADGEQSLPRNLWKPVFL